MTGWRLCHVKVVLLGPGIQVPTGGHCWTLLDTSPSHQLGTGTCTACPGASVCVVLLPSVVQQLVAVSVDRLIIYSDGYFGDDEL